MPEANVALQRMKFGRMLREGKWLCEGFQRGNIDARVFDDELATQFQLRSRNKIFDFLITPLPPSAY
jgi:hypothetical protein